MKIKPISKPETEPPPSTETIRDGVSVTVNPPFRDVQFAANKKLTEEDLQKLIGVPGGTAVAPLKSAAEHPRIKAAK